MKRTWSELFHKQQLREWEHLFDHMTNPINSRLALNEAYKRNAIAEHIGRAVRRDNTQLAERIFKDLDIPDNLTFKEKLCYYQLLGNEQ